jgi:hypothetical protein
MKTILNWRRHHYLARASVFLIAAALIVGMVGCGGDGNGDDGESYTLTITSTSGGLVIEPGEGSFTYDAGATVNLTAEADEGYSFVEWTGNVSTVANANAATTAITMNGHYSITANFAVEIWDWYDLDAIRDDLGGSYLLMNDLDSTTAGYEELASPTANIGKGWEPIGSFDDRFSGTFNGQGYEIRDLFINRPAEYGIGLFGYTREGIIKNIGVETITVIGYYNVGALVGYNEYGYYISDSYSFASVTGDTNVGGLVGANEGTVSKSYSTGDVTGNEAVGGLVGEGGTVINCYSASNVTGDHYVGGLTGGYCGTVVNSYSTGSVTGNSSIGGLVGLNSGGTVTQSFWDTETSGQATSDGGTGMNTTEMQDIATFSGATWDIVAVGNPSTRNTSYIWNIVDDETYPFLSWEPVS